MGFIGFELWFLSKANLSKDEIEFRRRDMKVLIRFEAPSKEQLTSVTHDWFHGTSFG